MAALLFGLLAAEPARSVGPFVVNSTADTGDDTPDGTCDTCTLREAIQEANANNNAPTVDIINFAIPGAGPHTISPGTDLPDIEELTIIDGYTQPGASENTKAVGNNADLRIRLDGDYPTNIFAGLRFLADDSVVRGLSITRFFTALVILGTDNNKIEGNFIGPGGTQPLGSPNSLFIDDGSNNNTIGAHRQRHATSSPAMASASTSAVPDRRATRYRATTSVRQTAGPETWAMTTGASSSATEHLATLSGMTIPATV